MRIPIATNEDVNNFRKDIYKSRKKMNADLFLSDLSPIPINDFNQMDVAAAAIKPTIRIHSVDNIGIYSTMMLIPRFKRIGYKGYTIDLKIPSSVSSSDRQSIEGRLLSLCRADKQADFKAKLANGETISVDEAVTLGLLDKVVDPHARTKRSPTKGVAVQSETSAETQTDTPEVTNAM